MYTDKELVARCLENDPKAQEYLYKRFARRMYGVCLRFARNTMEADDMLQEGFIKVFTFLKDFRNDGSLEGWVRRTIVNTAINYYHSKENEWKETSIDKAFTLASDTENILSEISTEDLLNLIRGLPEGYRMVFNLYAIEGYSHQEIAEMLKISENTSKSQLSRARAALQDRLEQRKK